MFVASKQARFELCIPSVKAFIAAIPHKYGLKES